MVLRRPSLRDMGDFLEHVAASRAAHRPWVEPPGNPDDFAAWVRRCRRPDYEGVLICVADSGHIAGAAHLGEICRGGFQNAQLGYYAFRTTSGRGHMTQGVRLILKHAFTTLALHRVEANIQPGNAQSIALAERCGFRQEGFSPRYLKVSGRWRDHLRYAITVEEWRRQKKA